MAIVGDKPSGYITTGDAFGRKLELETRQCGHCQATWIYLPGSGHKRGFCRRCMRVLCGHVECMRSCIPWERKLGVG